MYCRVKSGKIGENRAKSVHNRWKSVEIGGIRKNKNEGGGNRGKAGQFGRQSVSIGETGGNFLSHDILRNLEVLGGVVMET